VGQVNVVPFVAAAAGVDAGSAAVIAGQPLPDEAWVDVGKASRLTTRDAISTRESSYEGPGRFRVCIGHKEEAWVREGSFESVGGAGERPGAEQWVATPLGAARYDAARMKIITTEKGVEVQVASGSAYFWAVDGAEKKFFAEAGGLPEENDQGWIRLNSGAGLKVTVPKPVLTSEGASAALDRCVAASKEAMALTASLGEADASLGDVGPKDIVARRVAHAACDVAHLRIQSLPSSPARDAFLDRVRTAEAGWKSLMAPSGHDHATVAPIPSPSGK
jgi:hypothetical protein